MGLVQSLATVPGGAGRLVPPVQLPLLARPPKFQHARPANPDRFQHEEPDGPHWAIHRSGRDRGQGLLQEIERYTVRPGFPGGPRRLPRPNAGAQQALPGLRGPGVSLWANP